MRQSRLLYLILVALCGCVMGCVPSPTATPPRRTPFPTLATLDGTPTLASLQTAPSHSNTPAPNSSPTRRVTTAPRPTNAAFRADTIAPLVQMSVQDPELPVSAHQRVAINVIGADNDLITRLDLYDNDVLFAQATAPEPSAVFSNQFIWTRNAPGKHTLRAVAFDASGNASAPAQLQLNIINNNRAPTVLITSPSGSKDAELGAPLLIQGVATDDVAVTRMDLIVDNQLVTFVKPDRPTTPFAVAIPWTPALTGAHNIVLRAYDNQNQSDDSLRYTVRVFDNQPPVVTAQFERTEIPSGDVLLVDALALANNGIARVELVVDEKIVDAANSAAAPQQTALHAALAANDLTDGAHSAFVRAFDLTGQTTASPRVTVSVNPNAPRLPRGTPASQNNATALPPTPTATPPLVLPPAPTIELELVGDPLRVVLPDPAQIEIQARGDAELNRIEVWARYPGETTQQLLLEENARGATSKTLTFHWNAPRAGIVEIRARVFDNLGQEGESALLRFTLDAPSALASLSPSENFGGTWIAESPAARFEATFTQIGRALRGVFVEKRADGKRLTGNIVSGAVNDKTVFFATDFSADASSSPHTLLFDCTFKPRPPTLTCNYTTENGERGSAVFTPLGQP